MLESGLAASEAPREAGVIGEYPAHREADVVLRDGSTVHVRPIKPSDEPAMLGFLRSLSRESLTLRFFSPAVNLESMARQAANVDYVRGYGLVATTGPTEQIAGHALYVGIDDGRAEVA